MNLDNWQYFVALAAPFIVAVINQPSWSSQLKRVVMIGVAIVLAIVTGLIEGAFTPFVWAEFGQYLVFMIGATQAMYAILKAVPATKVALDKLEVAASRTTPQDAVTQKAEVKAAEVRDFQSNVQPV